MATKQSHAPTTGVQFLWPATSDPPEIRQYFLGTLPKVFNNPSNPQKSSVCFPKVFNREVAKFIELGSDAAYSADV